MEVFLNTTAILLALLDTGKIVQNILDRGHNAAGTAIERNGLDAVDRNMLTAMIVKFGGRPVGLDTIAAATGEDASTIEDVYEPYLLRLGFIARTPRGRVLLPAGYSHMGYAPPQDSNGQTSFI